MEKRKMNRRDFLCLFTAATAGVVVAACAPVAPQVPAAPAVASPTPAPTPAGPIHVGFMYPRQELTEAHVAQFERDYPDIKIDFINEDLTRLAAMWAAGNPPDLWRLNGVLLPKYLIRKMLKNLEPFIEVSTVIKKDDLAPCHVLLKWDGRMTGQGDLYGVAKDWSPEFSLYLNKEAFEEVGAPLLPEDKPSTYAELFELARKLNKKEGDQTVRWGFGSQAMTWAWTQTLMECLDQMGQSLYTEDFTKMVLVDNPEAVKIVRYWYDLAKEDLTPNPLNPTSTWEGDEFTKGRMGMVQFGYWFSPMAESDVTRGKVLFVPAPLWAGTKRRNPCAAATCTVMSSQTKVPDAAWKAFEWYSGKEPAIERAKSGWGVPALKSLYPLMPRETPFQQQVQRVLAEELKVSEFVLKYNPYYDAQGTNSVAWQTNLEKALRGMLTFEEMLKEIEKANNDAIQEGIQLIS